MTLVPLTPYSPLLWQVSLAGALAPKTQLGVVTHDGAAYLKAPTTDAGTGPDSFTRRFQKLQRTHLQHQSIAELSYTRAAVAAAVEAAKVAAAKTAREAAMKTAARRASAAALTLTLTQQLTAFRAANAADAAVQADNTASAAPTAAEEAQSIEEDGVASRGTSKPHPVRFSELRPPTVTAIVLCRRRKRTCTSCGACRCSSLIRQNQRIAGGDSLELLKPA